jgi:hypothetical protein
MGDRVVVTPCWGDVISDRDVLTAIFEQAGFAMYQGLDNFSVEKEGYTIHFEFDAGRLSDIRMTVAHRI